MHILARVSEGGKVVVTGVGKNLHIGQKIASTLTSTGTPAVILHPGEAMHGDLGILSEKDVLLALSYSGASDELIGLLPAARRQQVTVIAVTGEPDGALAGASDVVLNVGVEREACPHNMAPTASTTATLALGDALAMVLLEARGFSQEDYAKLHPGGAIGRTLLLSVRDVMRTGDRLAITPRAGTVREAVLAMTSCRSGAVAIVDEDNQLAGILTDGDLRRLFLDRPNPMDEDLVTVMIRDPVTIQEDELAVDILKLFEMQSINDLVVVNDRRQVVGHVDLQDLPKFKIL
jgi:arabinose-5-phosphate isomerase